MSSLLGRDAQQNKFMRKIYNLQQNIKTSPNNIVTTTFLKENVDIKYGNNSRLGKEFQEKNA